MTSKISFFNLCKECLRHHFATALVTIFCFLLHIIIYIVGLQNTMETYGSENLQYYININTEPNFFFLFLAGAIALMLSFDGFNYLHSKKKMDFYESLPVSRKTMFQVTALGNLLVFLVPLVLSTAVELICTATIGYCSGKVVSNMLFGVLLMLLTFLAVWATAVLALVMTGHSFIALLGFGVFTSYSPIILRFLFPAYAEVFLDTYSYSSGSGAFNYFSPVTLSWLMVRDIGTWTFSAHGIYFLGTLIFAVVIGGIAYVLYLKRPSEAAGRAMAFPKANPAIRFLIVIPMALYTGIYLNQLAMQNSLMWLFFGILSGAVLFHCIVEYIYQFDIRGILAHKEQLLACAVICLAFTGTFIMDLFGYNTYLPKADELSSIKLSLNGLENINSYSLKSTDGLTGEAMGDALALVQDILEKENLKEFSTESGDSYQEALSSQDLSIEHADVDNGIAYFNMHVEYHLKNGKVRTRNYPVNAGTQMEFLNKIVQSESFKDDHYALYSIDRSLIKHMDWDDSITYETLKLTNDERDTLIDTYLSELTAMTYSDILNTCPVSELQLTYKKTDKIGNTDDTYYIYPTFIKTIALLNQYGVPASRTFAGPYEFEKISVSAFDAAYEQETNYLVTDPAAIEEIKPELLSATFVDYTNFTNYDDHYTLHASIKDHRDKETESLTFYIPAKSAEKLMKAAVKSSVDDKTE